MHFYAIYAGNLETVLAHDKIYSTKEFHKFCEEAPKVIINGQWESSPIEIVEWLIDRYGFYPVSYTATYYAF